jgi:type II secretory pathway component PulL
MSTEEQLARELGQAISKELQAANTTVDSVRVSASEKAETTLRNEEDFYQGKVREQQIADMASARTQREKYARWVFLLVAGWIIALFVILIAQGLYPKWHPFSDKVLLALIGSMTVNLIGTLVIVLKYIFKS